MAHVLMSYKWEQQSLRSANTYTCTVCSVPLTFAAEIVLLNSNCCCHMEEATFRQTGQSLATLDKLANLWLLLDKLANLWLLLDKLANLWLLLDKLANLWLLLDKLANLWLLLDKLANLWLLLDKLANLWLLLDKLANLWLSWRLVAS